MRRSAEMNPRRASFDAESVRSMRVVNLDHDAINTSPYTGSIRNSIERPPSLEYSPVWEPQYSSRDALVPWIVDHHKDNFISVVSRKPERWWSSYLRGYKFTAALQRVKTDAEAQQGTENTTRNGNPIGSGKTTREIWVRPNNQQTFRVNLAELQRMRLRQLQSILVKHVKDIRAMSSTGEEPKDWEQDLDRYIKTVQDYDYMVKCKELPRDPFLVTGERKIDDYVIRTIFQELDPDEFPKKEVAGAWEEDAEPIGSTRGLLIRKNWWTGFWTRLGMAALGAFFLIAPMWLIVLHNTLYTGLVSTTVFVGVFGLLLAWKVDAPKDVLLGTAGYAAVLVVFVGLGSTSS